MARTHSGKTVGVEERFKAAVNVIKGLPKDGPYQPSTSMMLKFYGLYKQATEGACRHKKPAFFNVVGKAKWDSWNDNRHLSKEEAMQRYVDSLREIIETMSFSENVQNFVGAVSGLDNINLEELDMVAPGMREFAESHPNSPFNSRTSSPHHGQSSNNEIPILPTVIEKMIEKQQNEELNGYVHRGIENILNGGRSHESDDDNIQDENNISPTTASQHQTITTNGITISNGTAVDQSDDEYGDPFDPMQNELAEAVLHNTEILNRIQAAVARMNADIQTVNQRMNGFEKTLTDLRTTMVQKVKSESRRGGSNMVPKWWPFENISPAWFALLVLWPFLFRNLTKLLIAKRQK